MTDEKLQAKRKDRGEIRRAQQEEDLRKVLSTREGRRFFWHVLNDVAGFMNLSFVGAVEHTSFREGRRSVGLDLMVEAQRVSPAQYVQALNEHLSDMQREQLQDERERQQLEKDES